MSGGPPLLRAAPAKADIRRAHRARPGSNVWAGRAVIPRSDSRETQRQPRIPIRPETPLRSPRSGRSGTSGTSLSL